MGQFFRSILLLGLLSSSAIALANLPRIVNGEDAPPGEFPFYSNLQANYIFNGSGNPDEFWPNCGSAIIAGHFLWTADHCLYSFGFIEYFWTENGTENQFFKWNFRLVVGLEQQDFLLDPDESIYYSDPVVFNQILPIDKLTPTAIFNQQDFTIIPLESVMSDPLLINKALYLGNKSSLEPSQDSIAIGFGNAACVKGDCKQVPDADTSYPNLRQVQLELENTGCEGEAVSEPVICVKAERVDLDNDEGYNSVSYGDSGGPVMLRNTFGDYVSYGTAFRAYPLPNGGVSNRLTLYSAINDDRQAAIVQFVQSWHAPTLQDGLLPHKGYSFRVQNLTPDTINLFDPGYLVSSDNVSVDVNSDCDRPLAPFEMCNLDYHMTSTDKDGQLQLNYLDHTLTVVLTGHVRSLDPTDDTDDKKKKGGQVSFLLVVLLSWLGVRRRKVRR